MLRWVLDGDRRLLGDRHPDTNDTLHNLAYVASRRGGRDAAFDWLEQAVANGYSIRELNQRDTDLDPLRGSRGFGAPVTRARDKAPPGRSRSAEQHPAGKKSNHGNRVPSAG